jgi:hypothetical protein
MQQFGEVALAEAPLLGDRVRRDVCVVAHELPWRYQEFGKLPEVA